MAYNKRYNPDALPAHVEPEQAASMLSGSDRPLPDRTAPPRRQDSYSTRPDPRSDRDSYSSRPQANSSRDSYRASQARPDERERDRERDRQRYSRDSRDSYDSRPHPPSSSSYNEPRYREERYKDDRQYPSPSSRGGAEPISPRLDRYQSMASPPPQSYGYQSVGPPPKEHHNRPPQKPPATPAPPPPKDANDRESLWPLFKAVDKDQSGALDERELRTALVNGDMSSFDPHTVKMMIRMFDTDRSGTINFDEFCGLWGFLAAWRTLFDRFDVDKSGNISYEEFGDALVAFGYRLSPAFVALLFRTYDRRADNAMSFDLFVQACISLKRMTDVFKKYDDDRDGYITLSFEEFLTGSQNLFLMNSISASTDTGLY